MTKSFHFGHLENRTAYTLHLKKNFIDHPNNGKVGSWILYYWEMFDKYQLLECSLNVLSQDVGALDAQQTPTIDSVPQARRGHQIQSSLPSVGSLSEGNDNLAILKVGEGLIEMVKESKQKLEEIVKESKRSLEYSSLVTCRSEVENRIYELGKNVKSNKNAMIKTKDKDKLELLKNFIDKDELELKKKEQELMAVITSFNALKEQG